LILLGELHGLPRRSSRGQPGFTSATDLIAPLRQVQPVTPDEMPSAVERGAVASFSRMLKRDAVCSVSRSMKRGAWPRREATCSSVDGLVGSHSPGDWRRQSFAGVLVGDGQDPDRPAVVGLVLEEVNRPHMIGIGSCHMAGHPSSSPSFAGLGGQPQPLIAPQALDTLAVAHPALTPQDDVDPAIPIAGMLPGQYSQPLAQPVLVRHSSTLVALRRAMLTDHLAGSSFRHPETTLQSARCSAASLRG
jgi:hypothetical protein